MRTKVGVCLLFLFVEGFSGCRAPISSLTRWLNSPPFPLRRKVAANEWHYIAGRVSGARPGQQIVVYARSGPWWVQPWPDKPFIPIKADSTWGTPTHLGFEYAALLVDPGFHPPPTMDTAPARGGCRRCSNQCEGGGPGATSAHKTYQVQRI